MTPSPRTGSAFFYDLGWPSYDDVGFYTRRIADLGSRDVLELGAGTGRVITDLAGNVDRVVGVDISAEYCSAARRRAAESQFSDRITIVESSAESLDLDQRFDLVIGGYHVFQAFVSHLDVRGFFDSVRRHLRPGGRCIINTFHTAFDVDTLADRWARVEPRLVWRKTLSDGSEVEHLELRRSLDTEPLTMHVDLLWRHVRGRQPVNASTVPISMRCYYPDTLLAVVEGNGFTVAEQYGGYSGEIYGLGDELVLELELT